MKKDLRMMILGPPGAGKGTQAALISKEFGMPYLSTGEKFREIKASGSELGLKAYEIWKSGALVPDEITIPWVLEILKSPEYENGFILDGFPRTRPQAEAMDSKKHDFPKIDIVLNIEIMMQDELMKRILSRRLCNRCNSVYGASNMPLGSRCGCGGELYQRDDDNLKTIEKRLKVFKNQTSEVIGYYLPRIDIIDGEHSIEEVFQQIKGKILRRTDSR